MRVKLKNSITIIVLVTSLGFSACKKDNPATIPSVSTTREINITTESAESGGIINDDGGSPIIMSGSCWSINKDPTVSDPKTTDQIKDGHFSSKLLSLIPGTTYHVRAFATNSLGTTYGGDSTFATLGKLPSCITLAASDITSNTSTLNGTVNPNDLSTIVTFEYGTTTSYESRATASQSPVTGNTILDVSVALTGMNPATTYHYRINTVNSIGTTLGDDKTFTTTGLAPEVSTLEAIKISSNSVTLNGTVNAFNTTTTVSFEYGTTTSYGNTATVTQSPLTGDTIVSVSVALTGLNPATTYHYRIKTVNSTGTTFGDDKTFTMLGQPAAITTLEVTNIASNNVTLNGTVNAFNTSTTVSFEYGTTTSYGNSITASPSLVSGQTITNVSAVISGLNAETTYHYRINTFNALGTTSGEDMSFTTLPPPPPDVYVTGSGSSASKQVAILWKNGVSQVLTEQMLHLQIPFMFLAAMCMWQELNILEIMVLPRYGKTV